jgi:hypothetical protein
MSLTVNSGYKSLNLYFTQPANAYYIDDISTNGTQQLQDDSLRTDVDKIYIWVGDTTGFSVNPSLPEARLVYSGNFQTNIIIDKINISDTNTPNLQSLADNKTYYIKYAITSKLDPEQIVVSSEVIGTTLDISLEIQGWLTRDPIEIETDSDGDLPTVFPPTPNNPYTGTFTVYKYAENITISANTLQYEIVSGSNTGGVTATIVTTNGDVNKGKYSITGITDLVGTVTLRATYTDPLNSTRIIVIDKILNVSKRRPGASASIVELNSNGIAFVKTANTGENLPLTLELSATVTNIISPIYKWYEVGVTDTEITFASGQTNSSSHTAYTRNLSRLNELIVGNTIFDNASTPATKTIRVKVTTTSDPNFEVSDTFTYYYVQEGSDAIVLGLQNENQSISFTGNTADSTILNSSTPITTKLIVARGSNVVDPSITDSTNINSMAANGVASIVFSKVATGVNVSDISINQTTGVVSIPRTTAVFPPDSFLSAEITFTATITFTNTTTTSLSRKLVINAVFDGQSGTAYWLVNSPSLLIKQKDGTLNANSISWTAKQSIAGSISNYTTGYFNLYKDLALVNASDYTVNNGTLTLNTLDANAGYYRAKLYSDLARTKLIDEDDIQIYEEGSDGVIVFNDNKNHTLSRSSDGEISSYTGTGTYFSVQQGTQIFTTSLDSIQYSYNSTQKTLATTKTLTAGQYRIKKITFGTGIVISPTIVWSSKFSLRSGSTTDLIFEDWNSDITLSSTILQSTVEFEIEYKKLDGTIGTQISTQRINVVRDSSTVIIDVENDSHQIPFTTANQGIYTYSGTKIQAFDSNKELSYKGNASATLNPGEWKIVAAVGNGITPAVIPTSAPIVNGVTQKYAEFGDHSSMTTETARIDYTITAKTFRNTDVVGILAGQTFTKVKNATALYRIIGATSVVKFNNGTFSSLTLTAQKVEGGTVESFTTGYFTYQIKSSDGNLGAESARSQTDTFIVSLTQNTDAEKIIIRLYQNSSGGSVLDLVELAVIPQAQDGQDGNLTPWTIVTNTFTAGAGDRIIANTEAGTFTISLPANPSIGTSVIITDGWNFAQNNLIIGRNGSKIVNAQQVGEERNINLDVQNTTYEFIYTGPQRGWDFTATAGPKGDEGNDATLLTLQYTDLAFIYDNATSLIATTPNSIIFTAVKQNIVGTVTFEAKAYDESNTFIGNVTLTGTGDTRTLTPENFNNITGVTDRLTVRYVKVTVELVALNSEEVFTDTVTINRLDNGTDAIIHQMTNESHILPATTLGVVSSYSGASTLGYLYRGTVNETMNWTITRVDSTGITTTLDNPSSRKISSTGTIGNIFSSVVSGNTVWTATISGLPNGSTNSLAVNDVISAVENSYGRLYTGVPTSVLVLSKTATTVTYRVTGGGTPIAGPIGGLAKGYNRYELTTTALTDAINTATSTVTATKDGVISEKVFSVAKSKDGSVFLILDSSNDNVSVATANDGTGGDYSQATTTITAFVGSINVLPAVTSVVLEPSSGVSFTYTKNGTTSSVQTTTQTVPNSQDITTLSVAITNLTVDNGKLTIKVTYLSNEYKTDFTITKAKTGPNGEPAIIYSIVADSEIQFDTNTSTFSPATVIVNAYRSTGSALREDFTAAGYAIRFAHSANKSSWTTIGTDTVASNRTLTTSTLPSTAKFFRYSLVKLATTAPVAPEVILDSEIDVIGQAGANSSVINIDIENDNHRIPFTADGTGTYTLSGTNIYVSENTSQLQYTRDPNPAAGYWTITAVTGTNITPSFTITNTAPSYGKPDATGKYVQIADHSAMTSNTASILYTIKAVTSKGVVVEGIQDRQTFSKSTGTAVYRIVGAVPITKSKSGVFSSVVVKGQKVEAGSTSDFGVVSQQLSTESSQSAKAATQTIKPSNNSTATSIRVRLYSDSNSTTVLDEADIKVIQDGLDATTITAEVSNDTHDIPTDSAGSAISGAYSYSGTDIQIFANTTELQYKAYNASIALADGEWRINTINASGITAAARPTAPATVDGVTQKYASVGDHSSMTSDTAKIDYIIEARLDGKTITPIIATQTFAKVKRTAIYRLINSEPINVTKTGTVNNTVINGQKIEGENITNNFGWITEQLDNGAVSSRVQLSTNNGYTTKAVATTKKVTIKLYETSSSSTVLDIAELKVLTDGVDADKNVTVIYSNDAHLVPVSLSSPWTSSGGLIRVYDGPTLLKLKSTSLSTTTPAEADKGYYNLNIAKVSGNSLTVGALSVVNDTDVTLANWSSSVTGVLTEPTVYRITAYIRTSTGAITQASTDASLVPTRDNVLYLLDVTPLVVTKNTTSPTTFNYTPASISINLYKIVGNGDREAATATKISVDHSTDGNSYGTVTDYTNKSTQTHTVPTSDTNLKTIRVRAYIGTVLVDTEVINVVAAGVKGDQGDPGLPGTAAKDVTLSIDGGSIKKAGTTFTPATITITLTPYNITTPTYEWSISSEGTFVVSGSDVATATGSSVVVKPKATATTSFTVTIKVKESGTEIFQKNAVFSIYSDGIGTDGKRVATGYVYYSEPSESKPGAPNAGVTPVYQFSTGTFTTALANKWGLSAPEFSTPTTNAVRNYWAATYTAIEGNSNSTTGGTLSFGDPQKTIGFSGLVTFSAIGNSDSNATTIIDGNMIKSGTVKADKLDTKGLIVRDTAGNIILGSGAATWDLIKDNYPANVQNTNVTLSASNGSIKVNNGTTNGSSISLSSAGIGAMAYIAKILRTNAGTYIENLAVSNQFIGNILASTNFNGTFEQTGGTSTTNADSTTLTGKILTEGTTGWAIGKDGKAVFNQVTLRGYLQGGTVAGQKVQVGANLRETTNHHGLTLSENDWNNIFLRETTNNIVYFRVNDGGANGSIAFSSADGILNIKGKINCTEITVNNTSGTSISTGMIAQGSVVQVVEATGIGESLIVQFTLQNATSKVEINWYLGAARLDSYTNKEGSWETASGPYLYYAKVRGMYQGAWQPWNPAERLYIDPPIGTYQLEVKRAVYNPNSKMQIQVTEYKR